MENSIQISIVIPVYNTAHYLERCLESITNQTFTSFEVILVDDGSTDSSKEIYKEFEKSDKRFQSFYQSNLGPSAARNVGIEKSKGKFLSFIDADDYVAPNYLKDLYKASIDNKLNLVCSGYFELSKYHENPYPVHDFKTFNTIINKEALIPQLFKGTAGVLWGKLFSIQIVKENQLRLHPSIKMSEDLLFVLAYSFYVDKIGIVHKNNYYYNRLNERGLSSNQDYSYLNYLIKTNKEIENILDENKFELKEFELFKKNRLWSLLKTICTNISVGNDDLKKKKKDLVLLLNDRFVQDNLRHLKENNKLYALQLFFLKKNCLVFFVYYSKMIKFFSGFKNKSK